MTPGYLSTCSMRVAARSRMLTPMNLCARECVGTRTLTPRLLPPRPTPPPFFFIQCITLPSKILWQCAPCRHEITSQKFFKGRTGAQTSEGSRVEPKLIHYMCCICLLLKGPERSLSLSPSLSKRKLPPDSFSWISPRNPPPTTTLSPQHSPSPRLTRLTSPGLTDELAHKVNTRFTLGSRIFI